MIKKAVIAAAGLGTRLLPFTKEQPKEMLPIYNINDKGLQVKPTIQVIFEQIYDYGIREFCFIVGRGKRTIEDHFTADHDFKHSMMNKNTPTSDTYAQYLENFYKKLEKSSIYWINQSSPLGFGHAVLQARSFVGTEAFFLLAGDTVIVSDEENQHLCRLVTCFEALHADLAFLLSSVEHPENYGIAFGTESPEQHVFYIHKVIEKPSITKSNLAIMPIYIFKHEIFDYLKAN